MSEPLVLVVLFATNPDPTAETLTATVRTALGEDAVVLVDTTPVDTDGDALAVGERVHSGAIARVSWTDRSFLRARLHVHVAAGEGWADEEIGFRSRDVPAERGRTVGYALASMVQRMTREAPMTVQDDRDGDVEVESVPIARGPEEPRVQAVHLPPESPPTRAASLGLGAGGIGTGALGGAATSGGGAAGVRWRPSSSLGLRAAVGARAGAIGSAKASTTTMFAGAGPTYRVPIGSSFEVGARADLLVFQHAVRRTDLYETSRARWLGAVGVMLEAGWSLAPRAGLVAAVGTEVAFGATSIRVGGGPVAEIPAARAVTELGLAFRF